MEDERSLRAVDVAIEFGEGRATKKELDSAYAAADAAADAAAYSAYAATNAAAYSAYAAANAAAYAAANAAAAPAYAAADAAADSASNYKKNQMETADICRKYLPINIWNIK